MWCRLILLLKLILLINNLLIIKLILILKLLKISYTFPYSRLVGKYSIHEICFLYCNKYAPSFTKNDIFYNSTKLSLCVYEVLMKYI